MNRILILLIFLVCISACQSSNPSQEGVLTEDQMVAVLLDIQLTEGMVSAIPIPYDSSGVLYTLMEKEIFIKHGVSDSVFTRSMKYYLEDAVMMEKIYARIIDSLTVMENNPGIEERM
ncbi:DUF4296 domain-containing protein [Algoriphagus mannitolivorans]|uniref:DUF4296 domain-containing protein n=1 Tax=Algoriphagus mannitolivorans TaxID=226504 RepID=UPI00047CEB75|nr:DUF4296 domain-containing protein [Algoriphagus mannitolivorans]